MALFFALGDDAIEELFILLADTGVKNVNIVLAPLDLRTQVLPDVPSHDNWRHELYAQINNALGELSQD